MKLICRPYQTEDDFWRMREFLREVFLLNNRLQRSWHVARLDYARWHSCLNCAGVCLEDVAFLWESHGQIIAFLMPDGGLGEAHLCVHPSLRTLALEAEMITVAEEHLAAVQPNELRRLSIWAPAQDLVRQDILSRRGYIREPYAECQWRRRLDSLIPDVPIAPGYTIRSLGVGLELLERCYASGLGFHDGDIQIAVNNRKDPSWYCRGQTDVAHQRALSARLRTVMTPFRARLCAESRRPLCVQHVTAPYRSIVVS
jgi:hypothetical protein